MLFEVTISRTVPLESTRCIRSPVERRWKNANGRLTMWSRNDSVIRVSSAIRRCNSRWARSTPITALNATIPPIDASTMYKSE